MERAQNVHLDSLGLCAKKNVVNVMNHVTNTMRPVPHVSLASLAQDVVKTVHIVEMKGVINGQEIVVTVKRVTMEFTVITDVTHVLNSCVI